MPTPHEVFREVLATTGDYITAIRVIRERFGLDLRQAKEVWLQSTGAATSLDEHEEQLADALEEVYRTQNRNAESGADGDHPNSPEGATGNSQG
jgi:hypothetical protein